MFFFYELKKSHWLFARGTEFQSAWAVHEKERSQAFLTITPWGRYITCGVLICFILDAGSKFWCILFLVCVQHTAALSVICANHIQWATFTVIWMYICQWDCNWTSFQDVLLHIIYPGIKDWSSVFHLIIFFFFLNSPPRYGDVPIIKTVASPSWCAVSPVLISKWNPLRTWPKDIMVSCSCWSAIQLGSCFPLSQRKLCRGCPSSLSIRCRGEVHHSRRAFFTSARFGSHCLLFSRRSCAVMEVWFTKWIADKWLFQVVFLFN